MTPDEQNLWDRYFADRSDANRNALAEQYKNWVFSWLRLHAYQWKMIEMGDLQSWAMTGLTFRAIPKFDPVKWPGIKFTTYSAKFIAGEVIEGIRRFDWATRTQRESGNAPKHWELPDEKSDWCSRGSTGELDGIKLGTNSPFEQAFKAIAKPDPNLADIDSQDRFESIISMLPDIADRHLMRMLFRDEVPCIEAGRRMNWCQATVFLRRRKAIGLLKEKMNAYGIDSVSDVLDLGLIASSGRRRNDPPPPRRRKSGQSRRRRGRADHRGPELRDHAVSVLGEVGDRARAVA